MEYYLIDGKLDLSILDEPIYVKKDNILEEIESISLEASGKNISETLEEMAVMFGVEQDEQEDLVDQVDMFTDEVLESERKEFDI